MGAGQSKAVTAAESQLSKDATAVGKKTSCGCSGTDVPQGVVKYEQRKTQDCLCLLVFVLFWVGMIVIGGIGLRYGQPMGLLYGTDYQGSTCGLGDQKGAKYTVYPRVNEDFILNLAKKSPLDYKFYGICVNACPGPLDVVCNYDSTLSSYNNTDKLNCMTTGSASPGVDCNKVKSNCWIIPVQTASTMFRCLPSYGVNNTAGSTCVYPPGVTSAYDPACIVAKDAKSGETTRPAKTNMLFDAINTARQTWGRWFGDLYRAWWVILVASAGVGLVFGFVWLLLAKWLTFVFVWGTIVLMLLAMGILTAYFYYKGGVVQITLPESLQTQLNTFETAANKASTTLSYVVPQSLITIDDSRLAYRIVAYISTAIVLVALALVVGLRKHISTAVNMIKLGAEALKSMPSLIFFPFTSVLSLVCFLLWWIFVAASLATAGDKVTANVQSDVLAGLTTLRTDSQYANATVSVFLSSPTLNSTFTTLEGKPVMNYLLIYHFFGLLWTVQFTQGFAIMTIAGAVCAWYFSRYEEKIDPATKQKLPPPSTTYQLEAWPLWSSFCRTVRFGLGTIATGSFLIAFLQFVRAVVAYIHKKMKDNGADKNSIVRFVMCMVEMCLGCIQWLIQIVTRNAYIYAALKGQSFCTSGGSAYKLIVTNILTLGAINVLSEVILFLGKVLISLGCGWVAYAIIDNYKPFQPDGDQALSSTWLVILVVLFFAYAVASAFMIVFDICIDTVLVCYITDKAEHNDVPVHMNGNAINSIVTEHEKQNGKGKGAAPPSKDAPSAPSAGGGASVATAVPLAVGPAGMEGVQVGRVSVVPMMTVPPPPSGTLASGSAAMYTNPQHPQIS